MTHWEGPGYGCRPMGSSGNTISGGRNFEGSCHPGVAPIDLTPALELAT